jgi:quinol monooxygenase YgiN
MIVRISTGHFDASRYEEVRKLLTEGGARLIPAIKKLPGCLHYYSAISQEAGKIVHVSVWDTPEHAKQMASMPEMHAEGIKMTALNVRFDPVVNHETVWTVTP